MIIKYRSGSFLLATTTESTPAYGSTIVSNAPTACTFKPVVLSSTAVTYFGGNLFFDFWFKSSNS